ncbi:MAG: hypothetical protein EF812_00235 [Methanosarcinales archaeon]|nr:MAG: hypothetical protein EF812_00235 [Methanosarcinales archaeon]
MRWCLRRDQKHYFLQSQVIRGPNYLNLQIILVEKNGIRAIERITVIHRDTISDVVKDTARNAREVTDFLIKDLELTGV